MDSNFDLTYIVSIKIQTTRELQILIGGSENHPLAEQSEEELDRMVAINLKEVWLWTRGDRE